jgi:outer membrane protein assembly factor BamB
MNVENLHRSTALLKKVLGRNMVKLAPIFLMASLMGGCGMFGKTTDTVSGWFGSGKAKGPQPATLPEIRESASISRVWSSTTSEAGRYVFTPVVDGEAVFVAGESGKVARLNLQNGTEVWRMDAGKSLSAGVGAGAGLVLVGSRKGELIALDAATGARRWEVILSSEVTGAPVVEGGKIIVRTGDGRIVGLNPDDGSRQWLYVRQLPALSLQGTEGLAAGDGSVYAGFSGGKLTAISASNGVQFWESSVSIPRGATELERVTDVVGKPVLDGKRVCAVTYQGRVACFDRNKGTLIWARETSSSVGLGMDDQYVYVTDARDAVTAYDKESGRAAWRQDKLANRRLTAPLPLGKYVVTADFEGYVHVLSREDGSFVTRSRADGGEARARPVDIGPGFAVQTAKGVVTAFKLN